MNKIGSKSLIIMKNTIYLLIIFLIFCFNSCVGEDSPNINILELDKFPMREGTHWVYSVSDSIKNINDTLIVSILGDTMLTNNKPVKIWEYKYSDKVDTLFANISGDTVFFYQGTIELYFEKLKIIFPLQDDKTWETNVGEANVNSNKFVKVPAISTVCYSVTIYPSHFPNSAGEDKYFISSNLGIIKYTGSIWSTLVSNSYHFTVWELINFSVK